MKNILFAASEGVPFIKTGGLADVVGSLPKCIDKEYYDVRVILPKYSCMKPQMQEKLQYITHFYMDFNWHEEYVGVLGANVDGIQYYFIDNEHYFTGFKPYGDDVWFEIEKYSYRILVKVWWKRFVINWVLTLTVLWRMLKRYLLKMLILIPSLPITSYFI